MSDEQWLCECGSTRCHDNTAELQGQLAERDKSLAEVNKRIMLCDEQHHRGYTNLQKDIESARATTKRLAEALEYYLEYYKETYDDKEYDEVAKEALAFYDQWEGK